MYKKIIVLLSFITSISIAGCSAAPEDMRDTVASTQEPVIIGVGNGVTDLPEGHFCYPTYIYGMGAHSQAPLYSGWDPQFGGYWLVDNAANKLTALPNVNTNPGASPGTEGYFTVSVNCVPFDNFKGTGNFTGPFGYSPRFTTWALDRGFAEWHYDGGLVSANNGLLWDTNSACWISGTHGFSDPGEATYLDKYQPPYSVNTNWRYNVATFPQDQEHFQCAWIGHNLLGLTPFYKATPGNPIQMSGAANWTCLISKIKGNIDDGYVLMNKTSNGIFWRLEVGGGVTEANAYCFLNKN